MPTPKKLLADGIKFNTVMWRLADALGIIPEGAGMIEADPDELMALAVERLTPTVITTLDQVKDLPRGSVLLCRVQEVFWLPTVGTEPFGRIWFAAGYGDTVWTEESILDWAPLTLIHRGTR